MQSVSLTLRDLKPQPLVRRRRATLELWRRDLETHLRYMVDERSIHHAVAPRIQSMLDYINSELTTLVTPSGSGTVEIEAGRFFYLLVNLDLRGDALKRKNDDKVLNERVLRLKSIVRTGHDVLRLPSDLKILRSELQKAVNRKDEKRHAAILAQWNKRQPTK